MTKPINFLKHNAKDFQSWIGKAVSKRALQGCKSHRFQNGSRVNTVKGIIEHPILAGEPAFIFEEGDYYVRCSSCELLLQQAPVV